MSLLYTPLDDIHQIHQDLRKTFRSGKTKSIAFRKQQLHNLCYLVEDNRERIKDALAADMRRSRQEAEFLEITGTLIEIMQVYHGVGKWAVPQKGPFSWLWFAMSPVVRHEPKGIVLIIAPFNYPLFLLMCPLSGAIAAGNTVLLKPSELSPATAALLTDLIPKYLDQDCYKVVIGAVPETTKILELPFDHILYTGNGRVARIVLSAAAKHLTPVTLEVRQSVLDFSGPIDKVTAWRQGPLVIDSNCDVKTAARRIMWGKLVNGGQLCLSPDYVLVPRSFQDTFVNALKDAYHELHPVDPKESGLVARMINKEHAMRVKQLIDSTKGVIVFGGEVDVESRYAAPSLIKDVHGDDSLMSEEIFGPFLPVVPVEDVGEAIEFINARDHPLAIYIFSNDPKFKAKVVENTQSGTVMVNDVVVQVAAEGMPFGGVGGSGSGVTSGKYSFDTFTHKRCTMDSPGWLDSAMLSARYTPYNNSALSRLIWFLRPSLPRRNASTLPPGNP